MPTKPLRFDDITPYKYRLARRFAFELPPALPAVVDEEATHFPWLELTAGCLVFQAGYCWDGSSGPTVDSKTCHRGSLIHDGSYQLLRNGAFGTGRDRENGREYFDSLYRDLCLEDGMSEFQATMRWRALRLFGARAAGKPPTASPLRQRRRR